MSFPAVVSREQYMQDMDAQARINEETKRAMFGMLAEITKIKAELHPVPPTLYIPLFVYPGPNGIISWQKVADYRRAHPTVRIVACINPSNGDFSLPDANFTKACSMLAEAGVEMLAYVYTDYGKRAITDVRARIDSYRSVYPMIKGGVFLDEMAFQTSGFESYYAALTEYCHSVGLPLVVGNPGTETLESYVGTVDCILVYESVGLPSLELLTRRTFFGRHDKKCFGVIPHSVASYDPVWTERIKDLCGLVYVAQDGTDGNPWNTLSPYVPELLTACTPKR